MNTINDLPEDQKYYTVKLSNKDEYLITGTQKANMIESESQWVEVENGSVFSKSFVINIDLDKEYTRAKYIERKEGVQMTKVGDTWFKEYPQTDKFKNLPEKA